MQRIVLIFGVLVMILSSLSAQVSDYPSSKRSADFERSKNYNSPVIAAYLDSANLYLKTDRVMAFAFLEQAYLATLNPKLSGERPKVFMKMGDYYAYYQQFDLAAINYQSAFYALTTGDQKMNALSKAVDAFNHNGDFRKSLTLISKSSGKLASLDQMTIFILSGESYLGLQKYDSAMHFFNKAESYAKKLNLSDEEVRIKLLIAKVLAAKKDQSEIVVLKEARTKSISAKNQSYQLESEAEIANYYQKNNMEAEEINYRNVIISNLNSNKESLAEEGNIAVDERIAEEKVNLAKVYLKSNQVDQTLNILNSLPANIPNTDTKKGLEIKKEAAKIKTEAYQRSGNEQMALQSYQDYTNILSDLYNQSEIEYQNISALNNQLRDHQWRIDFLEQDKALYDAQIQMVAQESQLQKERLSFQKRSIVMLIILIGFLVGFMILLAAKIRVQQRHNDYLALKSLRTQMNPHFIFNALNSINNFIVKNDELNANKYLGRFSHLMRSILHNSEKDFITLAEEIKILQHYLEMEQMRFPDKMQYSFKVDENIDAESFNLPPMVIQPYIENAIWHGLRYLDSGGFLSVSIEKQSEQLKITIEDNGIGRTKSMELKTPNQLSTQSKGMKNTQGRFAILSKIYKKEIRWSIVDVFPDGRGTRVEIWLPDLKSHNKNQ